MPPRTQPRQSSSTPPSSSLCPTSRSMMMPLKSHRHPVQPVAPPTRPSRRASLGSPQARNCVASRSRASIHGIWRSWCSQPSMRWTSSLRRSPSSLRAPPYSCPRRLRWLTSMSPWSQLSRNRRGSIVNATQWNNAVQLKPRLRLRNVSCSACSRNTQHCMLTRRASSTMWSTPLRQRPSLRPDCFPCSVTPPGCCPLDGDRPLQISCKSIAWRAGDRLALLRNPRRIRSLLWLFVLFLFWFRRSDISLCVCMKDKARTESISVLESGWPGKA
mmetsp:Transcript_4639/g.10068  ORF Transcript_4639/g.10068 Transcript_4639/m.10068 type:complete len:273 (+) Transcript_4639:123-941(+)